MKNLFGKILGQNQGSKEKLIHNISRHNLNWIEYQYRHQLNSEKEAIAHYLQHWRTYPIRFDGFFDSEFYLSKNPDVATSSVNPLVHFLVSGELEGRVAWPLQEETDAPHTHQQLDEGIISQIHERKLDWASYKQQHQLQSDVEAISHYLQNWGVSSVSFNGLFDSEYYLNENPDVASAFINPLVHFITHGENEGRRSWPLHNKVEQHIEPPQSPDYCLLRDQLSLNWGEYRLQHGLADEVDYIEHYLNHWKDIQVVFDSYFDSALYIDIYPDLKKHKVNPLLHFVQHGSHEGRIAWVSINDYSVPGQHEFRADYPTIIVTTHETSATGAPVVALEIARNFAKKYNIICISLRKGSLSEEFGNASFLFFEGLDPLNIMVIHTLVKQLVKRYNIEGCITNSVESLPVLNVCADLGIPSVSLIHEFAEYIKPKGKLGFSLLAADMVIYPAETLLKSGLTDLRENFGVKNKLNHIRIHPQGSMRFGITTEDSPKTTLRKRFNIPKDAILIVGAGHVQPRKGVDWFVETAYYIQRHLRQSTQSEISQDIFYVWIGDGFDENDLSVSVWIQSFINRSGLKDKIYFSGHVESVVSELRDVDVFLLTSRLDPFPNVAIDALDADCGIGCFADASGIVDFVVNNGARCVVAPYGDCEGLATLVIDNIEVLINKDQTNSSLVADKLCFDDYITNIEAALSDAQRRQRDIQESLPDYIDSGSIFDGDFYSNGSGFLKSEPARHFLSLLRKGVVVSKPRPGSSIQHFLDETPYNSDIAFRSYANEALHATDQSSSAKSIIINGQPCELFNGRIAIHFHVYYQDIIPEYCAYFECLLNQQVDIYISHVTPIDDAYRALLEKSATGVVYYIEFPNSGRDVYPFHVIYLDYIMGKYDIIGHFHTKKSKDSGEGLGDRWRRYLLANLIGSPEASAQILAQFNDPSIGLIYADDHHCVDEASNAGFISELLSKLNITPAPTYHHFPLGTMFWARADALKCLVEWDEETFSIPEPIPYDGSVLHAFERIIPQIIESAGFESIRIYTPGTTW